jgi:hypothetical protein
MNQFKRFTELELRMKVAWNMEDGMSASGGLKISSLFILP